MTCNEGRRSEICTCLHVITSVLTEYRQVQELRSKRLCKYQSELIWCANKVGDDNKSAEKSEGPIKDVTMKVLRKQFTDYNQTILGEIK